MTRRGWPGRRQATAFLSLASPPPTPSLNGFPLQLVQRPPLLRHRPPQAVRLARHRRQLLPPRLVRGEPLPVCGRRPFRRPPPRLHLPPQHPECGNGVGGVGVCRHRQRRQRAVTAAAAAALPPSCSGRRYQPRGPPLAAAAAGSGDSHRPRWLQPPAASGAAPGCDGSDRRPREACSGDDCEAATCGGGGRRAGEVGGGGGRGGARGTGGGGVRRDEWGGRGGRREGGAGCCTGGTTLAGTGVATPFPAGVMGGSVHGGINASEAHVVPSALAAGGRPATAEISALGSQSLSAIPKRKLLRFG